MAESTKIQWMDNLRVIATISVIFLHVSASILYRYGKVPDFTWWVGNVFDGSVRYCVPVFVLLSGALLLPKEMSVWEFYKKRFVRVLLPFLFFALVFIIFTWYFKQSNKAQLANSSNFITWLVNLIQGGVSFHFWFIYMILTMYLIMPFLGKWVRSFSEKQFYYFFAAWLFLLVINIPILYIYRINNFYSIYVLNKIGYVGYLVLGYYLATRNFVTMKIKRIALFLFISGVAITIIGTYLLTYIRGQYVSHFYGYLSPNVLIASVGLFLLFKNSSLKNKALNLIRDFINQYSFGIYLVHVLVLDVFYLNGIYWDRILGHPILSIPIITILCLLVSSAIIFLLNKIPVIGKYISG